MTTKDAYDKGFRDALNGIFCSIKAETLDLTFAGGYDPPKEEDGKEATCTTEASQSV